MNQELFDNMQKQMIPSPQVRAALSEKLSQAPKKRPVPWKKYSALAACAALVIGGLSVYNYYQNSAKWTLIVRNFQHDTIVESGPLHSYVTVDGITGVHLNVAENAAATETGGGINDTGGLPGGAYVGDVPVQEGAEDYQKLMDHFNGTYPDWYGGAYLNESGWLVVQLVEDKDPADKSLELQVLDWTGSGNVMFSSCKYSLAGLNRLMDQLNAFPEVYPMCRDVMASWGVDQEANHIELTLTEADENVLSLLGSIDPDGDAIYVQVGQRASTGEDVRTDSAAAEDPAVHHAVPGGDTVPDGEDLIADEPYYDGAHYDLEDLPGKLPKEEERPASTVDSAPEEDASAFTPAYDPDIGFISPKK